MPTETESRTRSIRLVFVLLAGLTLACALAVPSSPPASPTPSLATLFPVEESSRPIERRPSAAIATPDPLEPISLPISIYILDDEAGTLSSARTAGQLDEVYTRVNAIWGQAGIVLEVRTISRVNVPHRHIQGVASGEFRPFLGAAEVEIPIPDPSLLNAFYAQNIGGPNGINPFGLRVFFVTDQPSVHSERVSAHEIGHILGLHHTLDDPGRLMFPGTNGMTLTAEEIAVARYVAQGLLAGVR
ncbi:MAG: matrixin family metalloprotease [Anaerolineae bacterium]